MKNPYPLHNLMHSDVSASQIICEDPQKNWGDLKQKSAAWCSILPKQPGQRLLLSLASPFEFTAALMASWQCGHIPVILPDHLPGTLLMAEKFGDGAICDDYPDSFSLPTYQVPGSISPEPTWQTLNRNALALELFTSGSTGERQRIAKTFAQLEEELAVLHELWGDQAGLRLATISHQHIYGLLFRILWPLCTQQAFSNTTFLFWETLLPKLAVTENATILSSPATLKHFAQAWTSLQPAVGQLKLFSSGGPLPRSVALEVAMACGKAPIEVLGSTETGGIAWRQQEAAQDPQWTPLPKVAIKISDEELHVQSPFLKDPSKYFKSGDRAEFDASGRFKLKGRLDRIAKVAEKRVSLTEMERKLAQHPAVKQTKLVVLPRKSDSQRDSLGCVVELSLQGQMLLFTQGRPTLIQTLKDHLKPFFEAVTLPRHWRFPEVMPQDSQSKIPAAMLLELFADKIFERPKFPELIHREQLDNLQFRYNFRVPPNLLHFEGHFKQVAVVAGVVQLHWIIKIIAMETGKSLRVAGLEVIKFHRLLLPNDLFDLELSLHPKSGKWVYKCFADNRKFASGRIIVESS